MEITLNGEKEILDGEKNVLQLLEGLELKPEIVTVNLNGTVLQKEEFDGTLLKEGDEVDILMFMGGGE